MLRSGEPCHSVRADFPFTPNADLSGAAKGGRRPQECLKKKKDVRERGTFLKPCGDTVCTSCDCTLFLSDLRGNVFCGDVGA